MVVLNALKALHRGALDQNGETEILFRRVMMAAARGGGQVLDVGCGYGRNLVRLAQAGIEVVGVEINGAIVADSLARGLPYVTPEEFARSDDCFDVVLMSHLIEHFHPDALLGLMDGYLDRLKTGGRLVVATPLMSSSFYDDFVHVKPYLPTGLMMVFGPGAQVQYHSRNRLALIDLENRSSPLRITHARARAVRAPGRFLLMAGDIVSATAFRLSGHLIGRTEGWIGEFEKVAGAGE